MLLMVRMKNHPFKSDALASARAIQESFPVCGNPLNLNERVSMVVDTNRVLSDLLWITKVRKNPEARPDLIEVADSTVGILYAPKALRAEVKKYIPWLAKEKGVSKSALLAAWTDYQKRITFRPNGPRKKAVLVRDPKDLPFINVANSVQAVGIISADHDIPAMGGRVISLGTIRKLRDYARAKVFEVQTLLFRAFLVMFLVACLYAIGKFLLNGGKRIGLFWVGVLLIVLALVFFGSSDRRNRTTSFFSNLWIRTKDTLTLLKRPSLKFFAYYRRHKQAADSLWGEIRQTLELTDQTHSL